MKLSLIVGLVVTFFSAMIVLGLIGWLMAQARKKKAPEEAVSDEVLSQKNVENVNDLGDNFNRARYMDKDGQ